MIPVEVVATVAVLVVVVGLYLIWLRPVIRFREVDLGVEVIAQAERYRVIGAGVRVYDVIVSVGGPGIAATPPLLVEVPAASALHASRAAERDVRRRLVVAA